MGNYDHYCACLGPKQERNIHEIKTDSYKLSLKEDPFILRRKSRSLHDSNKYVRIIDDKDRNSNEILENNNKEINTNNNNLDNSMNEVQKKDSNDIIKNNIYIRKKKNNYTIKEIKSDSSSSSNSSSSNEEEEEENEEKESKEYSDEGNFITETLQNYEKLFKNKYDPNGWKRFYAPDNRDILKLIELGNDRNKIKSYCEIITKIKNKFCLYKGHIDEDNNLYGYGQLYYKTGEKFEGIFDNGKLNGWGRHINSKGLCFEGLFKNNILIGKGIIIKEIENNNDKKIIYYEGDIMNFSKEGIGTEKTDDYIYEGAFKNNLKEGKGKITYYKNGESYDGDFTEDEITGNGCYIFSNKNSYKGEFLKGKMHGKGVYKWWKGNEYEGEFANDIKEGYGEYRWNNGRIYRGNFSKGTPHGKGVMIVNGVEYETVYEYGKFVGNNFSNLSKSKLDYESEY